MCEVLGYNNFCSACKGSREENGELVCKDKDGKFYGIAVKQVLMAPCMKSDNFPTQKIKELDNYQP